MHFIGAGHNLTERKIALFVRYCSIRPQVNGCKHDHLPTQIVKASLHLRGYSIVFFLHTSK